MAAVRARRAMIVAAAMIWLVPAAGAHDSISAAAVADYLARIALYNRAMAGDEADGVKAERAYDTGIMLGEMIRLLNDDLAMHAGEHTLTASVLLEKARALGIPPERDPLTGLYRPLVEPFTQVLALQPDGPRAAAARYQVIVAQFYDTQSDDPFAARDYAQARAHYDEVARFRARYPDFGAAEEREEIAFILAIEVFRLWQSAPDAPAQAAIEPELRAALDEFRRDFPDSLRLGAIDLARLRLGQGE